MDILWHEDGLLTSKRIEYIASDADVTSCLSCDEMIAHLTAIELKAVIPSGLFHLNRLEHPL